MKEMNFKKKITGNNFIYDNFILGWEYMKKSRVYFIVAIILILLASLIGYFRIVGFFSSQLEESIDGYITRSVQEIVKQTENLSPAELIVFIVSNNIKTAFFGMLSGVFLAVSPIIVVIFNGYVLGFVVEKAVNSPLNSSGIFILWRLFPHGIFEIPAILISIGLGIKIGLYPFYIKEKGKGLLSLSVAFAIFLILSAAIIGILSLFIEPGILLSKSIIEQEISSSVIVNNPLISFIFYALMTLSFIVSFLAGLNVLSNKDRVIVKEMFKNSFRVFVFIIIPLLVIAGLIEGGLIFLVSYSK